MVTIPITQGNVTNSQDLFTAKSRNRDVNEHGLRLHVHGPLSTLGASHVTAVLINHFISWDSAKPFLPTMVPPISTTGVSECILVELVASGQGRDPGLVFMAFVF